MPPLSERYEREHTPAFRKTLEAFENMRDSHRNGAPGVGLSVVLFEFVDVSDLEVSVVEPQLGSLIAFDDFLEVLRKGFESFWFIDFHISLL